MTFRTADLCDSYGESEHFQIAEPIFRHFGQKTAFWGQITTLKIFEDIVLIREALEEKVENRVLIVDGGGSHRCALMGGRMAALACHNGWQGVVIYGCIRDKAEIDPLPIGVRALHTHPLKGHLKGGGSRDILITFAGVNFKAGHYVYADEDGIIIARDKLLADGLPESSG